MDRKGKILSATIMIVLMVVLAYSGTVVQAHPLSTSSSSTNSSFHSTGRISLLYLVRSGRKDVLIQSSDYIIGSSVATTTALVANNHVLSSTSSSTNLALQSLEFSVGRWHSSFSNPITKGKWSVTKLVEGNKEGLVSYASVTIKNEVLGINKTLSVSLESTTFIKGLNFNNSAQRGLYLFFVPQLISPTAYSSISHANSGHILYAPSSNNCNGLRLAELDNNYKNAHVWHFQANLNAWSPTYGGYFDSYVAEVTSPYDNWWLESSALTTSVSVGYQIEACANAYFFGVFPIGYFDLWFAYPQVGVTATFTNHGTVFSGTINDPIYVWSQNPLMYILWRDVKVNVNSFSGYKDVHEYIINL